MNGNLVTNATEWLERQIKQAAGQECVYTRGSTRLDIRAVFGKLPMETVTQDGAVLIRNIRTAMIAVKDLAGIIPRPGDRIETSTDKWVVGFPELSNSFEYLGITKQLIRVYLRADDEEMPTG